MSILLASVAAALAISSTVEVEVEITYPKGECGRQAEIASIVAKYRKSTFGDGRDPNARLISAYQGNPKFHAWLLELNNGHMKALQAETLTIDKCLKGEFK